MNFYLRNSVITYLVVFCIIGRFYCSAVAIEMIPVEPFNDFLFGSRRVSIFYPLLTTELLSTPRLGSWPETCPLQRSDKKFQDFMMYAVPEEPWSHG